MTTADTISLHVGMDKTGTSALQTFFHENRAALVGRAGILYPDTGLWHDFSHHRVAFSCLETNGYSQDDLERYLAALSRELRGTPGAARALLSSECLFKAPLTAGFARLRDYLSSNFVRVEIIVYVRRQDVWVDSRYRHSVLSGHELTLDMLKEPRFCDYKRFIDRWADDFGKASVIVRRHEPGRFVGGSIFSDFLSLFGLSIDDFHVPRHPVNVSLHNDELCFKEMCNRVGYRGREGDVLNDVLRRYAADESYPKNTQPLMSHAERAALVRRYSEVNAAIARDFVGDLGGVLFQEDPPESRDCEDTYEGIDDVTIGIIKTYIRANAPRVARELEGHCRRALESDDAAIRGTASRLLSIPYQ
ncbi:MAG: hypothetical protein ACRD2X_19590 [Vicinamibacteraceae bacterium]